MSSLSAVNPDMFARLLVSEGEFGYQYPEAALAFADYALAKYPEIPEYMDTYARIFYSLGDLGSALHCRHSPKLSVFVFNYFTAPPLRPNKNF